MGASTHVLMMLVAFFFGVRVALGPNAAPMEFKQAPAPNHLCLEFDRHGATVR